MPTIADPPPVSPPRLRTMAEFVEQLGDVPLDRILIDPPLGKATEADLLHQVEVEKRLCELVDGSLVEKPMGVYESILAMLLVRQLLDFVLSKQLGLVCGPDGPVRLRLGLVRLPDISYVAFARIDAAGGIREQIPSVVPNLAVEVLSPGNTPSEMRRKREEYFRAGVELVWQIDPPARAADVYTSVEEAVHVERDGELDGGAILPGLKISLADLFSTADRMTRRVR